MRGEVDPAGVHEADDRETGAVRSATGSARAESARRFGLTVDQIEAWEQGRSRPVGGVRTCLTTIESDHEAVVRLLDRARPRAA